MQRIHSHAPVFSRLITAFAIITSLMILGGCRSLDDDTLYAPSTQTAFFLVQDTSNPGMHSIAAFTDSTWVPDWQAQFQIDGSSVTNFAGAENTLWLNDLTQGMVHQIDLATSQRVDSWSTQGTRADLLAQGSDYLCFFDVPARRLGFYHLKKEEIYFVETDSAATSLHYNSGKFYVVGNYHVEVFSETALATLSLQSTDTPIAQVLVNKEGDLVLMACDGTDCKQYVVDANGDVFTANSPVDRNYQRQALSPYLRQQYGRELLEDFRLRNGNLEPTDLDSIQWFSIDFFESDIYYTRENQSGINRVNYQTQATTQWIGNPYQTIKKTFFYIDHQAN